MSPSAGRFEGQRDRRGVLAAAACVVALIVIAPGCGNKPLKGRCAPGAFVTCTCDDGVEGTSICTQSGAPGICACGGSGGTVGGGGRGGAAGDGGAVDGGVDAAAGSGGMGGDGAVPDAGGGGRGGGGPDAGGGAGGNALVDLLPYRVLDSEYSAALEVIVMVSSSPMPALHVYDPKTHVDRAVALPLAPAAVSVSPDGKTAAVAHDGYVSTYDLVTATAVKTCPVSSDAIDVVMAANGSAYVFPRTDQWSAIHAIRLATCAETLSSLASIYAGTVAKLHPSTTKIYGADRGLSPSDIERYAIDATTGAIGTTYDSPYHGDYPMCGDLWMSEDGLRIFTACGRVFRSSDIRAEDMTYNGRLEGSDGIRHLTHSAKLGKVYLVPSTSIYTVPPTTDADLKLRVHSYEFLTFDKTMDVPAFPATNGAMFKGHARFVFVRADGASVYVVMQADAASGVLNDYAVATLTP